MKRITIYPYRKKDEWFFDDDSVDLVEEPLVQGVPEMIELFRRKKNLGTKIKITFSASSFKKHDLKLEWDRSEQGGNWYYAPRLKMECWLCPALFCYFPSAPKKLYVRITKP